MLEHIVNPMQFINECVSLCNHYMFIEVPCLDIKMANEPYGTFADEHVNYFTIQSLWNLMSKAGFSPIEFEIPFGTDFYLPAGFPAISTLWKKAPNTKAIYNSGNCLERYLNENEVILNQISKKIDAIPNNEKLALWGIAHHASMLLANTNLAQKNIVRAYDSDKRKTGLKVLDIPITPFEIDDINSGEVESILITTYTAQNSILKAIEKMNLSCKIYKLYDI